MWKGAPGEGAESISLLRLDTDWYESTRHELVHLFPRVSHGGVLIVDDYGQYLGARKAVDEYFSSQELPVLLNRMDYSGRMVMKR
jgi:O-methyltransferase